LPQTGYHALGTPYSFIGLGRTNNYVEVSTEHGLLLNTRPNSQLIINPPSSPVNDASPEPPVKAVSTEWRTELFLHPGDWIPWVGAAVVGTVLVLVFVAVGLHEKEKVRHAHTRAAAGTDNSARTKRSDSGRCMRSISRLYRVLLIMHTVYFDHCTSLARLLDVRLLVCDSRGRRWPDRTKVREDEALANTGGRHRSKSLKS
jgi:hypothetical protein